MADPLVDSMVVLGWLLDDPLPSHPFYELLGPHLAPLVAQSWRVKVHATRFEHHNHLVVTSVVR